MRTAISFFGSVLLIATLALGQAEKPPERAGAPATVAGEVLLNVSFDPKLPRPDLGHFIMSQPSLAELSRKILNLEKPPTIGVSGTERGSFSLRFRIDRKLDPDVRPAVREFAEAVLAALPGQLREEQQKFVEREIDRARIRLLEASHAAQRARESLNKHRAKLRDLTGRIDAVENWSDAVAAMEQERHRLTIDLAGQQARRKAIEETVAKVTKQAEARAEDDPIGAEFSKILAIRERELAYAKTLAKTKDISESAIADIEMKVADAKAKLLERREVATRSAGGELLADLNRELLMLSITGAEHEARLKAIRESLDRFHGASDDVDALKRVDKEVDAYEAQAEQARKLLIATEERYQNVTAPTISVIDTSYVTLEQRPQ